MTAEILAIGEEICSGVWVDCNSARIAQKLEEIGVKVLRHSRVGDDLDVLVSVINEVGKRADVAVVTGGLGPTRDDLAAEAAAKAAGVALMLDDLALQSLEDFCNKRKQPMSNAIKKQAWLPQGADCLYNPIGTAPGFSIQIGRCLFFFLPGVPSEMIQMMSDQVVPRIIERQGQGQPFYLARTVSIFGLTESVCVEKLAGLEAVFSGIKVRLLAKFPEIQLKLYVCGSVESKLNERLEKACRWVSERIGDNVFSVRGESMEQVVGDLLRKEAATLAVAESCTGGLISHLLTNVSGSSDYLLFSGVTYANQAKIQVLGVAADTISLHGAVHETTAKEMAQGARKISGASYGLSTSGIAGPSGGTADKPVGTVCIGLASAKKALGYRFHFTYNDRLMNKQIFAMTALDLLRRALLQSGNSSPFQRLNPRQPDEA